MNRGNQRNARGQQRRRSKAGSSSASTPLHGSARNNNNANKSQSKREEDETNHVPGTNVVRIMTRVIPSSAKISDGAKEAVQECVSEYIGLITSEANERCLREHRKTLTPEDILYALGKLGFDDYVQPLTLYLNRYRESESERTSVDGEPHVVRTVTYQHLQGPRAPPPPPPSPPPGYFNRQVAPPAPGYFVNPAAAMNGSQGYRIAPPGSTVDAGPSAIAVYANAPHGGIGSGFPYNAVHPPPPGFHPGRQFFP